MTRQADEFEHESLRIRVDHTPLSMLVQWRGASDTRDPSVFLLPLFKQLLEDCKGKAVTLDFSSFEYMNSATVTPILNFVKALDAKGVASTLVYDGRVDWQRVNFQLMKTIARTLKHVRVETR